MMQLSINEQSININPDLVSQAYLTSCRECGLCALEINQYGFARICGCSHSFCSDCLYHYMRSRLGQFEMIVCPAEGCKAAFDENCNLYFSLSEAQKKKYKRIKFAKQIEADPNLRHCPDEQCEEGIIKLNQSVKKIGKCIKCKKQFCLKCNALKHDGSKCDAHEARRLQKNFRYRQCCKCKRVIERMEGCNHITCKCGFQFCYICGEQWRYDHTCSLYRDQELICNKFASALQECCCSQIRVDCSEIDLGGKLLKGIQAVLYYPFMFLFALVWFIFCVMYSALIFVALLPVYMVKGGAEFFQFFCCSSDAKNKPIAFLLFFLFLPISLLFLAGIFFYRDAKERHIEWVWRICFTASC